MGSKIKDTIQHLAHGLFSLPSLIKLSGQRVIYPFYHTVSDVRLPHIANLYPVKNANNFKKDLEKLCKTFTPLSLQEITDSIYKHKPISKPSFHLTFDDGLKEVYTIVAPILLEMGIPATVFINSAFADNKDLFYRCKCSLIIEKLKDNNLTEIEIHKLAIILNSVPKTIESITTRLLAIDYLNKAVLDTLAQVIGLDFNNYLQVQQPYLSTDQIISLTHQGFSIGAHSVDHPWFKDLSFEDQKIQVSQSLLYLTQQLNIKHLYFSFPFSDEKVSKRLMRWMYENEQCLLSFGISGIKKDFDDRHLHRIPMEGNYNEEENIIEHEYLYYLLKRLLRKNTVNRND